MDQKVEFQHANLLDADSDENPRLDPPKGQSQDPAKKTIFKLKRFFVDNLFSSISRRIAILNLLALVVMVSSILYINQFRDGLIDAKIESLMVQGRIIAAALATSANPNDGDIITIDPDKLLRQQAENSLDSLIPDSHYSEFNLAPEHIAPLLISLVGPTQTRARVYGSDGAFIIDTRHLAAGKLLQGSKYGIDSDQEPGMIDQIGKMLNQMLPGRNLPPYRELIGNGSQYPEVKEALIGGPATIARMTNRGELIISVAVPIKRAQAVGGVLLLSTQGGTIDRIVAKERIAILRVFLVAFLVILVLSLLLASTIANPLKKLSAAARKIRGGISNRTKIPDFTNRKDEIGELSASLRTMTEALYNRIEAIERFAADVSHELKNPLTSLRSAVETLPMVKHDEARDRLLGVIQHDVLRLDRLITDIADASRLDADLVRETTSTFDLAQLISEIISVSQAIVQPGRTLDIRLIDKTRQNKKHKIFIQGHKHRIGQVFTNLIDNARSFVPATDGLITIKLMRQGNRAIIEVSDNGPGVRADDKERIFERFYTDRSEQDGFGQNSGLGLSISRQIIQAHGGTIKVQNIAGQGAQFTIELPVASTKSVQINP